MHLVICGLLIWCTLYIDFRKPIVRVASAAQSSSRQTGFGYGAPYKDALPRSQNFQDVHATVEGKLRTARELDSAGRRHNRVSIGLSGEHPAFINASRWKQRRADLEAVITSDVVEKNVAQAVETREEKAPAPAQAPATAQASLIEEYTAAGQWGKVDSEAERHELAVALLKYFAFAILFCSVALVYFLCYHSSSDCRDESYLHQSSLSPLPFLLSWCPCFIPYHRTSLDRPAAQFWRVLPSSRQQLDAPPTGPFIQPEPWADDPKLGFIGLSGHQGDLNLFLNGKHVRIAAADVNPLMTLNDYLRRHTTFTGTKRSCTQGFCSACAVNVSRIVDGKIESYGVNSCLYLLAACDGVAITTVEGLGNSRDGYHPIQRRVAGFNGSQCGFCTPGMVMSIYSRLKEEPIGLNPKEQLRVMLDSNFCRCTGYMPLWNCVRSFSAGSENVDEGLYYGIGCVPHYEAVKDDPSFPHWLRNYSPRHLRFSKDGKTWCRPVTVGELIKLVAEFSQNPHAKIKITGGNQLVAFGAMLHKPELANRDIFIDINSIPELQKRGWDSNGLFFGSATTLSNLRNLLGEVLANPDVPPERKKWLDRLHYHLSKVASTNLRNSGTVAGNLLACQYKYFPSDVATPFFALGAEVTIQQQGKDSETMLLQDFLTRNYDPTVIVKSFTLPFSKDSMQFVVLKVMKRPQNCISEINASFNLDIGPNGNVRKAIVLFGGTGSPFPQNARQTEALINGKAITSELIAQACACARREIEIEKDHYQTYRQGLVVALLWKGLQIIMGDTMPVDIYSTKQIPKANATDVNLGVGLGKGMLKSTAYNQSAGEVKYTDDLDVPPSCAYAYYVNSQHARAKVMSVDASEAERAPGVICYMDGKDIPGKNEISRGEVLFGTTGGVGHVGFYGQAVGMVVAETYEQAKVAASLVKVHYEPEQPILTIEDAINNESYHNEKEDNIGVWWELLTAGIKKGTPHDILQQEIPGTKRIKGSTLSPPQQHFYMEMQTSLAKPVPSECGTGDGVELFVSAQWPSAIQLAVARILGVKQNIVSVKGFHVGGAFGGKLTRSVHVPCAVSLAAVKLRRPVRMTLDMQQDMWMTGGREDLRSDYDLRVTNEGRIEAIVINAYLQQGLIFDLSGWTGNEAMHQYESTYKFPNFALDMKLCKTNTHPRSTMRAPSFSAAIAVEQIMQHIAHELKIDACDLRKRNWLEGMDTQQSVDIKRLSLDQLIEESNYEERLRTCKEFNAKNRFTKRGIGLVPIDWDQKGFYGGAIVNIYTTCWHFGGQDGSILVSVTGNELGQGLYTKCAMAAAETLAEVGCKNGVPIEFVRVQATNSDMIPNACHTGVGCASELCVRAVQGACKTLVARLQGPNVQFMIDNASPYPGQSVRDLTWPQLISILGYSSLSPAVDLQAQEIVWKWAPVHRGAREFTECVNNGYKIYGASVTEIELDTLTGESVVLRSDLVYDGATPLNPVIDLGQIQGAYMQGVGAVLREEFVYNEGGDPHTEDHWFYKAPTSLDVPSEFYVSYLKGSTNEKGVCGSKTAGEPPILCSISTVAAMYMAVQSARGDLGLTDWVQLDCPMTVDKLALACGSADILVKNDI